MLLFVGLAASPAWIQVPPATLAVRPVLVGSRRLDPETLCFLGSQSGPDSKVFLKPLHCSSLIFGYN